jgi:S1-C subfamily serine protease
MLNAGGFFMASNLAALSQELAAAVERAGKSVVGVQARPRFGSSGVAWREGIIVTAEHTVRREDEIPIVLADGKSAVATIAGSDPGTDLTVLRTDAPLTPVTAGGGDRLQPGQLILAVGRSEDTGVNATMGIVSALGPNWRTWRGGRLDRYIRLDLTIYPGSSGGAVVNTDGSAIGIATSALSRIAGVAIPATTIDRVVDEILRRGHVARGYLGVGLQPVELPDALKAQQPDGGGTALIVLTLQPDGPAAHAGVLIGDILVALNGRPVHDTDDIQGVLETHAVGQQVQASLIRGGVPQQVGIVIGERPRRSE